jgi:hypothetical protein
MLVEQFLTRHGRESVSEVRTKNIFVCGTMGTNVFDHMFNLLLFLI